MSRWIRAAAGGVIAVLTLAQATAPASAQTLFEELFGRQSQSFNFGSNRARTQQATTSRGYTIPREFQRQTVRVQRQEAAGTIVVDTKNHFLYLMNGDGTALRYGIGVARDGFEWSGTHRVTNKREWPGWTPPAAMLKRQPHLPRYMEGGPNNPLGARALYLGSTLYRIHGTNEPWTIGQNVSSGCIRMTNDDVTDLYERVQMGARVIVI